MAVGITLKMRTNPAPCKHTVVTAIEDGVEKVMVFHDSDFENDEFVPEPDNIEIYKIIKERLKVTGKVLSKSKADFDGKTVTTSITKEVVPL